jgi:hypothetical protein
MKGTRDDQCQNSSRAKRTMSENIGAAKYKVKRYTEHLQDPVSLINLNSAPPFPPTAVSLTRTSLGKDIVRNSE